MSATVRITGELAADAQLRMTAGEHPSALLFLQIQPTKGLPFLARKNCGSSAAEILAAKCQERLFRRGQAVVVEAAGITPRTDHDRAVLMLEGVTAVHPAAHAA